MRQADFATPTPITASPRRTRGSGSSSSASSEPLNRSPRWSAVMDLNFEPEQQHGGPCRHSPTRMRRPAPQPSTARPMEVDAAQDVRPAVGLESPILPPAQPKPSAGKAKAALSFDDRSGDSSDEDGAHQPKPTPELSPSASDPPKPQAGQTPRFRTTPSSLSDASPLASCCATRLSSSCCRTRETLAVPLLSSTRVGA